MTSELVASADYRFGMVVGEMATVPAGLSGGVTGSRDGYRFRVWAPDTRDDPTLRRGTEDTMWCLTFGVEVRTTAPRSALDPDGALLLNGAIARDLFTSLVLNAPNLGFPGTMPKREGWKVTIDGEPAPLTARKHDDPNAVMILHDQVVSLDALQEAASGTRPPSRARTMVAEAGYQVLFNPNASRVTAVVVAASACEIATHACVRRVAKGNLQRLTTKLIPPREQAVLSPKDVIDVVLPVLTGRRLSEENSGLWGAVRNLMRVRDTAVHQGKLPPRSSPSSSWLRRGSSSNGPKLCLDERKLRTNRRDGLGTSSLLRPVL